MAAVTVGTEPLLRQRQREPLVTSLLVSDCAQSSLRVKGKKMIRYVTGASTVLI
jgi:hypothetical protein